MPRKISEQVATFGVVTDFSTNPVYLPAAQNALPAAVEVGSDLAVYLLSLLSTTSAVPVFQDWRDGTASKFSTLAIEFEISEAAEVAYNTGDPVIDYGDGGTPETIDDGKTRTLNPYVMVSGAGDCDLIITGVSGALISRFLPIVFYNDGAVAAAPDIVTTNAAGTGVTITSRPGISNPGLGTDDGDWLMALVWLKSATEAVIMQWIPNE